MAVAATAAGGQAAKKARPGWPKPKNGHFLVYLLAGGPPDRAREIRDQFATRRGSLVKYHLDYEKHRQFQRPIPKDVDIVLIVKSMLGHSEEGVLVEKIKAAGVPYIRTSHKWSNIGMALNARFGNSGREAKKLPLEVLSTAYLRDGETETEPEPPKYVMSAPAPATTPAAARLEPELRLDPEEMALLRKARLHAAGKDTLMLIREIQLRLAQMSPEASLMIDQKEFTFYTGKPPVPPTLPEGNRGSEQK